MLPRKHLSKGIMKNVFADLGIIWILLLLLLSASCHVTLAENVQPIPRPCSDIKPIYLTDALTSSESSGQLPAGVKIDYEDESNTHAYTFTESAGRLGFPAKSVFTYCDYFPAEFSVLVTFKASSSPALRSRTAAKNKEEEQEILLAVVPTGGSTGDPPKFGIGLYKGGALRIFYREKATKRPAYIDFDQEDDVIMLDDGNWHTVIVSIAGHKATLSVDCDGDGDGGGSKHRQKRRTATTKTMKGPPSLLNVKDDFIHIGNGNRGKRGLFTGKLKQVVFLSGSDITPLACPDKPPHSLNEGQRAGVDRVNHVTTSTANHIPLTAAIPRSSYDKTCSWQDTGQTWFDVRDRTLKVCYSGIWQPILLPPDQRTDFRLDYFVWHQNIVTAAPTIDLEVFSIPGEGLFLAAASFDSRHRRKTQSTIFRWGEGSFRLYQSLYTYGAQAWEFFQIQNKFFLAVANRGVDDSKPSYSIIYRWSPKRKRFRIHQELLTWDARDIEYFQIDDLNYLIVANHKQGDNHTIQSVLYRMNPDSRSLFEPIQNITTVGAYDWTHFSLDGYHFLAVANSLSGPPEHTTIVKSVIYFWRHGHFLPFQHLQTVGATDFEFFTIDDDYFLAVANAIEFNASSSKSFSTESVIYKLDIFNKNFQIYQTITTHSAVDWESFTIGNQHYLLLSNAQLNTTAPRESVVYQWKGVEKFVAVHRLPTMPCADWEAFEIGGQTYIVYANSQESLSQIYKAKLR